MQTATQNAGGDAFRPTPESSNRRRVRTGWLALMVLTSALIPVTAASAGDDRTLELSVAAVAETPGCAAAAGPANAATAIRTVR